MLKSALATVLFLFVSCGFAQQFVVIESTVKNIAVGAVLDASFTVSLRNQEKLTVIAENGVASALKAPYNSMLSKLNSTPLETAKLSQAIGRMLVERRDDMSTLGTVRRLGVSMKWLSEFNNEAWNLISAEHEGVQCVVPDQPIRLVRNNSTLAEQAQLRSVDGVYQALQWKAGEVHAEWPRQITLDEGRVYLLRRNGSSIPYRLQLRRLAPGFMKTAPAFQLATLIGRNCMVQATWVQHASGL